MPLRHLPAFKPRHFVPQACSGSDIEQIKPLYEQLLKQPVSSKKDFKDWLDRLGELDSVVSQAGALLYIEMTCQTDDPPKANAYREFIEKVVPVLKPMEDQLNKRIVALAKELAMTDSQYDLFLKALSTDISLFRHENIDLQTKVNLLSQQYQAITGSMMVQFKGKEYTMPQMAQFLYEPDRQLRQEAWEASSERRLKDKDALENIFDQMFKLRHQMAVNAGFANFVAYQFQQYHRFDYTPGDCKKYHEAIETLVMPLYKKMMLERQKDLGLSTLRPWDTAVDALNRAPLKPFSDAKELVNRMQKVFDQLDPELSAYYRLMNDNGLLDLESRKGKAPGGYQQTLSEARLPFIFMNAVGVDDDVRTLMHESGHAFHALASREQPLAYYRHAPMEFCEVASMSMELIAGKYLNHFYQPSEAKRSLREHLEGVVHTLVWVATIDAFQQWLYEHPQHTPLERKQAWYGCYQQFSGQCLDWTGYHEVRDYLWHRQLHVFEVPFYYIEYGIAQLGALQLWALSQKDQMQALNLYKKALALGGSRPLGELFKAAGICFDFSAEMIEPLIKMVEKEWQKSL